MKEIMVKVYKLEELEESIQNKIIDNWRNDDFFDNSDEENTLEKFSDIMDIKVSYNYGDYRESVSFTSNHDDEILELSGIRLMKYVSNNFFNNLYEGKYYSNSKYVDGKFINKFRHSKVMFETGCTLTGTWIDMDILSAMIDVIEGKHINEKGYTFEKMINECLHDWLGSALKQYEYWISEDCIREDIEANETTFLEDGRVY